MLSRKITWVQIISTDKELNKTIKQQLFNTIEVFETKEPTHEKSHTCITGDIPNDINDYEAFIESSQLSLNPIAF